MSNPVDDESTLAAAWIYNRLSTNAALVTLLGVIAPGSTAPSIARYQLPQTATYPGIIYDLIGGTGDVIVPQATVWTDQIWNVRCYTSGPESFDDLVMGPILYYVQQSLSRQRGAFLSGRIVDCWRNRTVQMPPEQANDQFFNCTFHEYAVRVALP